MTTFHTLHTRFKLIPTLSVQVNKPTLSANLSNYKSGSVDRSHNDQDMDVRRSVCAYGT